MNKLFVSLAFALSASALTAGTPDIAGQWKVHQNIVGNESDQDCTFTVAEKKITGNCKTEDKTFDVTGSIDGNKVTWKYDTDYNGSTLTLVYTATLGDGGKFSGDVEVQPMSIHGDFTATAAKKADK